VVVEKEEEAEEAAEEAAASTSSLVALVRIASSISTRDRDCARQ